MSQVLVALVTVYCTVCRNANVMKTWINLSRCLFWQVCIIFFMHLHVTWQYIFRCKGSCRINNSQIFVYYPGAGILVSGTVYDWKFSWSRISYMIWCKNSIWMLIYFWGTIQWNIRLFHLKALCHDIFSKLMSRDTTTPTKLKTHTEFSINGRSSHGRIWSQT